jgi:RNA polymerase sigma-70 factor (ECF subfamily)
MRQMGPTANEEKFLRCYDEYADAIYRHCYFRVFSKPLAEELVQEAFMRTWEYLSDGREVENLRAFVYRVANNLIIDHSRKKKEEKLEEVLEKAPALEPATDGAGDMERNAFTREILRIIAELPSEHRRLITLRYIDELEPGEIADILDISPNHASVKLNRAMKVLRRKLKKEEKWIEE